MENTTEMAVVDEQGVAVYEEPFTLEAVVAQVQLIQGILNTVMVKDEHFGVIPGTGTKPTLLKPGAEKLCLTFRLRPEYTIIRDIMEPDFIYYRIECVLVHIPSGRIHGSGIGSCNSREEKYRWTNVATDEPVPREYWKAREKGDKKTMLQLLGADGKTVKKGGAWYIARRVENVNPYDKDNTLLKMAEKRALVAAILVSVAASDIFTQDLEDMVAPVAPERDDRGHLKPAEGPTEAPPTPDTPPRPASVPVSDKAKRVSQMFHDMEFDFDGVVAYLKDTGMKIRSDAGKNAIEKHLTDLSEDAIDKIIDDLNCLISPVPESAPDEPPLVDVPPERDGDWHEGE